MSAGYLFCVLTRVHTWLHFHSSCFPAVLACCAWCLAARPDLCKLAYTHALVQSMCTLVLPCTRPAMWSCFACSCGHVHKLGVGRRRLFDAFDSHGSAPSCCESLTYARHDTARRGTARHGTYAMLRGTYAVLRGGSASSGRALAIAALRASYALFLFARTFKKEATCKQAPCTSSAINVHL